IDSLNLLIDFECKKVNGKNYNQSGYCSLFDDSHYLIHEQKKLYAELDDLVIPNKNVQKLLVLQTQLFDYSDCVIDNEKRGLKKSNEVTNYSNSVKERTTLNAKNNSKSKDTALTKARKVQPKSSKESKITAGLDYDMSNDKYIILHKTIPIGTGVILENPKSDKTVYAKVEGRPKNVDSEVIYLNRKVYDSLEIHNEKNQITISFFDESNNSHEYILEFSEESIIETERRYSSDKNTTTSFPESEVKQTIEEFEPQNSSKLSQKSNDEIHLVPEVLASFPGGMQALSNYLKENLKYPKNAQRMGLEGYVFLSFVINKKGEINLKNFVIVFKIPKLMSSLHNNFTGFKVIQFHYIKKSWVRCFS
uniref:energy transducer TonB n=1 Tax=Roseivirga sp. TaxID=1964215 RepID=UPI0040477DFA